MGVEWNVIDHIPDALAQSAPADATGIVTVTFDPVGAGLYWRIERIRVQTTSTTTTTALVYVGDVSAQNLRDGSIAGNSDNADYSSPLVVPPSRQLQIVWSGMSLGAVATAIVQHQLVERIEVGPARRLGPAY